MKSLTSPPWHSVAANPNLDGLRLAWDRKVPFIRWGLQARIRFLMMALTLPLAVCFSHAAKAQVAEGKAAWMPPDPPAGFFIPLDLFGKSARPDTSPPVAPAYADLVQSSIDADVRAMGQWLPEVHLYASPATQAYFVSGGLDAKANQRIWEVLLRKYKIPFKSINSAERLEKLTSGVLLLPSSVVLTDREKQAVLNFRAKGGSVLASWLTGVRGENVPPAGLQHCAAGGRHRTRGPDCRERPRALLRPLRERP